MFLYFIDNSVHVIINGKKHHCVKSRERRITEWFNRLMEALEPRPKPKKTAKPHFRITGVMINNKPNLILMKWSEQRADLFTAFQTTSKSLAVWALLYKKYERKTNESRIEPSAPLCAVRGVSFERIKQTATGWLHQCALHVACLRLLI